MVTKHFKVLNYMKAILFNEFGAADQLYLGHTEPPSITSEEVLVKVHATALNRADLLQRQGLYPPPKGESEILGLEMAGSIDSIGSEVSNWKKGDRVFALLAGGGYAEYVKVHQDMLIPLPSNLSFTQGAAIAEAFLTAWQALSWLSKLNNGETILIHAGASGVGSAAIQIAKVLGTKVVVTASKAKHDFCKTLGADLCIDYRQEDFSKTLKEHYPKGADVLIDFIGASYFHKNIDSLALDGRMVHLGFLGGTKVEEVNLMNILLKRLRLMGSTLRARSLDYKIKLTRDFEEALLGKFENGSIHPIVDEVFDWKEVTKAHQYMEANKNKGKIILEVTG